MKKHVWIGSVAAVAVALGCGAAAQTSGSQTGRPDATGAGNPITVSGCLQQGSAAAVGTTGSGSAAPGAGGAATASTPAACDQFTLTNVMPAAPSTAASGAAPTGAPGSGAAGNNPAGTSGTTSPAPSSSAAGTAYILEGNAAELRTHANQQVQVTGRIDPAAAISS